MTRRRRPLDVRNRLLVIVLSTVAFALIAATVGFNLLLAHTTSRDADRILRERVDSERAALQVRDGRIRLVESVDESTADSRIWVFRGNEPLEAPPAHPRTLAAARSFVTRPAGFLEVPQTDERLYGVPIYDSAKRVGTVVAGISLAPYEETRREALTASLFMALLLLAIVGVAAWWLLRSALRPVARMTDQAAAWSETDLDRRFLVGEPHDELTRLAATLDALLDRIAASLRHERLLSAELSHELRTPLAKLAAEAELALRRERTADEYREALGAVLANAAQLSRIVEALLAAAQQEGGSNPGVSTAASVAQAAAAGCSQLAAERGVDLEVDEPDGALRIGVEHGLAERILQPVVENACLYGHSAVRVSVARSNGAVLFMVDDDGPGVDPAERETIFEPAARGLAGRNGTSGAGLGLALARRLARSASGDVVAQSRSGGGRFVIRLPAA
jgi:signal transduction histidine kinase